MVIINNNNLKDNVIDNYENNQAVDIDNKVELNDNEICNSNKNVYYGDLDKNIISNSRFSYNYFIM